MSKRKQVDSGAMRRPKDPREVMFFRVEDQGMKQFLEAFSHPSSLHDNSEIKSYCSWRNPN